MAATSTAKSTAGRWAVGGVAAAGIAVLAGCGVSVDVSAETTGFPVHPAARR